jgi:RNA polymerase sigma-70 factor (ECF subfamily)
VQHTAPECATLAESAILIELARARQPSPPVRPPAQNDATRLILVPSEATSGELMYERVAPVVYKMVWLYLATDPERDDIAQDILVAVLRGASSVRDPALLESWVSRVAYNTICNVFRRRKLVRWLSLDALASYEPPQPSVDFDGRELLGRTQRILEHLPVAERMAFTLQLLGNLSLDEIARRCGCSERTARRRIKAARARFTRLVQQDPTLSARLAEKTLPEESPSDG